MEIKTEVNSDTTECPQNDRPSTSVLVVPYSAHSLVEVLYCIFDVSRSAVFSVSITVYSITLITFKNCSIVYSVIMVLLQLHWFYSVNCVENKLHFSFHSKSQFTLSGFLLTH